MNILLVEPNYKNKYPPMGLMKIASYHKNRNDFVVFVKGEEEFGIKFDRIYITSLFTFDYKKTLDTIKYYAEKYESQIYLGGISATLVNKYFLDDLKEYNNVKIVKGLLESSSKIDMEDGVNIDMLYPDYTILSQIVYKYTKNTGYIGYTTRGCTNKCAFCAVPKLEPKFEITNNLTEQYNNVIHSYREMRDLILLDNNILSLSEEELETIIVEIEGLGFGKNSKFKETADMLDKLYVLQDLCGHYHVLQNVINERIKDFIFEMYKFLNRRVFHGTNNIDIENFLVNVYDIIIRSDLKEIVIFLSTDHITNLLEYICEELAPRRGSIRRVDFNQGMDARQLTENKMRILSRLNIVPFRLALDDVASISVYEKAIRLAARYEVKSFSNYLLYNFNDTPNDLYVRMKLNIDLANELGVRIYSFPMRFAPVNAKDRKYIGKNWNRYYLSSFRRILNPTMGIVSDGIGYFERAFGKNFDEFIEILSMPADYVVYRTDNEKNGNTNKWRRSFNLLSDSEKENLIDMLSCQQNLYSSDLEKMYKTSTRKK